MSRLRKKRGSAITFSAVLALVLVVLGLGFLFFTLYMGGQTETKNSCDAGMLNVGRQVLDNVTVDINIADDSENTFLGVCTNSADTSVLPDLPPTMDLHRINRMWGQALLIAINADADQQDSLDVTGEDNAKQAFQGAQAISNRLADKLNDANNIMPFFDDFTHRNSVRMIGKKSTVSSTPGGGWQTSCMDRDPATPTESNMVLNGSPPSFNMPPGYTLDTGAICQTQRVNVLSSAKDMWFLRGYTPITAAGQTFWQVPFQFDEKPHAVSSTPFKAAQPATLPIDWAKPVPNAFSGQGTANKTELAAETASSWVLTNPRQPFQLSIPHSFMHIHLDDLKGHFYFFPAAFPVEFGAELPYGYTTDDLTGAPMPGGGILCTTVTPVEVTLGFDVLARPLDFLIFQLPAGDTTKLEAYMVNRINEMLSVPGATKTASDLHSLLDSPAAVGWIALGGERDFYIFSPDGSTLTVQPKDLAMVMAPWLIPMIGNDPDGKETKLIDDASMPAPMFFEPIVTPDPFCSPFLDLGVGTWEKDVNWQPGTGYNGNLGQVRVTRWTDVYSIGACNPF